MRSPACGTTRSIGYVPSSRNTIGTLLYHIAAIELDWLHSEILEREFPGDFRTWFRTTCVTQRATLQSLLAIAPNGTRSALATSGTNWLRHLVSCHSPSWDGSGISAALRRHSTMGGPSSIAGRKLSTEAKI